MDDNVVQVPATLDGVKTLQDGTLRITFETQETTRDKAGELGLRLFRSLKTYGWLLFGSEGAEVTIPDEPPPGRREKKTPSKRLRDVLFRLHEKVKTGRDDDFESFYAQKMEEFIRFVKGKIDAVQRGR